MIKLYDKARGRCRVNPKVKQLKISTNQLSPVVLKSSMFTQGASYPHGFRLDPRYVFDYELEYYLYSEGAMVIEGMEYPLQKGDIVIRKPGQYVQGVMPYTCYLICFDLLGNTGKDPDTYELTKEQEFQDYYLNPFLDSIPPVFHNPFNEKYQQLFDLVLKEYLNRNEGSEILLKMHLLQILYELYIDVRTPFLSHALPVTPYYAVVKKAIVYIKDNLQNKITLSQIAGHTGLSPNHFHRIFSKAMNITPSEYLTKLRLDRAKEQLVKTNLHVSEIALQCGFDNIPYFSYVFKKQFNISPGEFRKRHNYI
jgi:AraC-like DNA-binding protein